MNLLYALICEDASVRPDGRVDVHGIFQQLLAPGFPAQQDRLVLVVAIEWDSGESGRIPFRIDLVDPSRSPALTINGHPDVAPLAEAEGAPPPQTRLVVPLENIVFPSSGAYRFELEVGVEQYPLTPLYLLETGEG